MILFKKQLSLSMEYNPISQFFGKIEDGHWSCYIELPSHNVLSTLKEVSTVLLTSTFFLFFPFPSLVSLVLSCFPSTSLLLLPLLSS